MKLGRIFFGDPIPKAQAEEHALSKKHALAIFSSDALSSVAYATGEILTVLILAGTAALAMSMHIAIFIAILIVVVGVSYKQAIDAYPEGGGAYIVARENLGTFMGLLAAGALMLDYILTVAVSVSAGILAITSAFPETQPHAELMAIIAIIFIMWMNLRGMKESASAFMWPTYAFVVVILSMVGIGLYRYLTGNLPPVDYSHVTDLMTPLTGALTLTLILRAFSSGCSAMTGIEAVANGVMSFKQPRAKNASITLMVLIVLLISMFLGISFLASKLELQPLTDESLLSQIGHNIFGGGLFYYLLQTVTCLILLLAANTSFAGFPLLTSMISKDGYLPRQLQNVGDRLAFSNGILALAVFACVLIIIFQANTSALIPLYSIGVFLAFTLCQAGLVRVWYNRRRDVKSWWIKACINSFGCLCTFIAVIVVIESKFFEGAWIIIIALPILILIFYRIAHHYHLADQELSLSADTGLIETSLQKNTQLKVIVPVSKLHKGTIAALSFARKISPDITPVTININPERTSRLQKQWNELNFPEKLVVLDSQYQSLSRPLIKFIRRTDLTEPERGLAVLVLPKAETTKLWHTFLHNQKTALLRWGLKSVSKTETKGQARIIVEVPYQLTV
ncbi:APC family permease [Cysteiniphilum halobium]|uniref:APC family permease n=1 Tax=Cysteiniphilum halobium TaxID=2219059 RepID=UPI000E65B230|nr:APC family permease [Cysteiniphilum halobium]